jgi:hypothetical protein
MKSLECPVRRSGFMPREFRNGLGSCLAGLRPNPRQALPYWRELRG